MVIAPWNFPLPIAMGMSSAALVTGNTVVYKPASQTPAIGQAVYDIFAGVGLPDGVFNFLPGPGHEIGEALVTHRDVAFTVFTGSKEVGLGIIEMSAVTPAGARQVKNVIAEMGGKNAIIIDGDADIDAAVWPVVQSAFGYMGQKCSAASRIIVLEENYDRFVSKFKHAVETLIFGPGEDSRTDMGAVIDAGAKKKIEAYIEMGQKEGTLLTRGGRGPRAGTFRRTGCFYGYFTPEPAGPGGNFRPRGMHFQSGRLLRSPGSGQRHAICPDRRALFQKPGQYRAGLP